MNQRGFIALPLTSWVMLGMGVIVLGLGIALKFQTARLESCKAEYQAFVTKVEALGVEAQKRKVAQEAQDKLNKEKADAERKKLLASNADLARRLRDNASSSVLPNPGPSARKPETACFTRADLDAALRKFTSGVAGLVSEGDQGISDLDNAKQWAEGNR